MRKMKRVLAVALALAAMAVPASAGTAADPELRDRCGGTVGDDGQYVYAIHESIDLCAVWFETLSDAEATPELRITIQVAGPIADRPPSMLLADWASGDCNFTVIVDDSTSASISEGLQVGCGEAPPFECTVPEPVSIGCDTPDGYYRYFDLGDGAIVENGDTLQFTVKFDGELAEFAGLHEHDDLLTGLQSLTAITAGPVYGYTFGCTAGLGQYDRCDEVNGDAVWSGRDYTVGS
jgi:hypothetical protein